MINLNGCFRHSYTVSSTPHSLSFSLCLTHSLSLTLFHVRLVNCMPVQHSGEGHTQSFYPVRTSRTLKNASLNNWRWEERSWRWQREISRECRRERRKREQRGGKEILLFGAEISVRDEAVLGFYQMMQRIISSQWEGFPHCCVSRLRLQWLFAVFQTISSCSPSHFCTWYATQHLQFVRVWIPIMELLKLFCLWPANSY